MQNTLHKASGEDDYAIDTELSEIFANLMSKDESPEENDTCAQQKEMNYFCTLCLLKLLRSPSPITVHFDLPTYFPRSSLVLAFEKDFESTALEKISPMFCEYLKTRKLDVDNAHEVFKILLEIEDVFNLAELLPYVHHSVKLSREESRVYSFDVCSEKGIEENIKPQLTEVIVRYASASFSDELAWNVLLQSSVNWEQWGLVKAVNTKKVTFQVPEGAPILLCDTLYTVIFRPHRMPVRYQHYALDLLSKEEHMRRYLFPQALGGAPTKRLAAVDLNLFNATLANNPEQLQAVRNIVAGPNLRAPFVIFGPPGTGKTTTIVESILQLRLRQRGSRILVAAGSNSACDTIALRLCEVFERNPDLDLLKSGLLRIFAKSVENKGLQHIDPMLLQHSNCADGTHLYPEVRAIHVHGIVVATFSVVGRLVTGHVGSCDHFTHVFIDEAGAVTEPEALVALMGIKSERCHVIMSGDHKQLGPVLKSQCAAALGLEQSIMERLLRSDCYAVDENGNYDKTLQARLCRNYRSHPEIVRLYNQLYYNNELIAHANYADVNTYRKWSFLANPNFPIIFQVVHGVAENSTTTPSTYNNLEIQVLLWYVHRLLVDGVDGQTVHQSDIGIITPYKAQGNRIVAKLKLCGWNGVETGPVETFQGREKPIIIVSLVRSFTGLGFVKHPRRLNVILSRAKSLLILLGNPHTLGRNRDLKFIIDECTAHGTLRRKRNPLTPEVHLISPTTAGATIEEARLVTSPTHATSSAILRDEQKIVQDICAALRRCYKEGKNYFDRDFVGMTILEISLRYNSVPTSACRDHPKKFFLNVLSKSSCHHQRYLTMRLLLAIRTADFGTGTTNSISHDHCRPLSVHFIDSFDLKRDYDRFSIVKLPHNSEDILRVVGILEESDTD